MTTDRGWSYGIDPHPTSNGVKQILTTALLLTAVSILISLVYTRLPGLPARLTTASSSPNILIGNRTVHVTVANTPQLREKGLSDYPALSKDEGMLFSFENDGYHAFWMKKMLFSIDIVWISLSGEIVDIVEGAAPESYPTVFTPRREARYVVELPAGFVREYSVRLGDTVRF